MIFKAFFVGLVVFVACSIWLYVNYSANNETYDWVKTPATISESYSGGKKFGRRRVRSIHTPVKYQFEGLPYEGVVDDFLVPGEGFVFVNPDEPNQAVGIQGANLQHLMRPLVGTVGSGLFLIVLILIRFSPSDD